MKLHRYNQFVKKLNEEREVPEYDTPADFRKAMGKGDFDEDEEFDIPPVKRPMIEKPVDDEDMPGDEDMHDEDEYMAGDEDMDMYDDEDEEMPGDESMYVNDVSSDEESEEYVSDGKKLYDLADMLDAEVVDNQVTYGDQVVNYYSETGNLHIGSKEFETAEDAAEYLKGGDARMVRDTNESRSYRFKRKPRY